MSDDHVEVVRQRDALLSLVEMWQEVDRSEAPTAGRYLALTDRRDTWLARYRAERDTAKVVGNAVSEARSKTPTGGEK